MTDTTLTRRPPVSTWDGPAFRAGPRQLPVWVLVASILLRKGDGPRGGNRGA